MELEGIKKYLSNQFVDSECMSYLDTYLSKYEDIICDIDWVNTNYKKISKANMINYKYSSDIIITIKTNNYYVGRLTIKINKYHNNIIIIDNLKTYSELKKDTTTICEFSSFKNGNSVITYNRYKNFNGTNQRLTKGVKLVFDQKGIITDYNEYEDNTKYRNRYDGIIPKRRTSYN